MIDFDVFNLKNVMDFGYFDVYEQFKFPAKLNLKDYEH